MRKIVIISAILMALMIQMQSFAKEKACEKQTVKENFAVELAGIGFHKKNDIDPTIQIKNIFSDYQKYTNNKNLEGFLSLHDATYKSSDGYDKERLKELAQESWKEFPDVRYTIKVLSIDVDVDNATVITKERLSGTTQTAVEFVKGSGYIDSESTAIYYLKRFSNEWRITSDFVVNEKTAMRYGIAKYIPMKLDAPSIVSPKEEYTAVLKLNVPRSYVALISINNEPITFPFEKSTEVFRSLKPCGIQERILTSNDGSKNENAVASVGIAKPIIKDDNINVNILGIAFLSSRVNVVKHKMDNVAPLTQKNVNAAIKDSESK